ncbi:MAG: tetratricopeptide repeat protein [Pseudobdellovibrionaceae bacterium]
MKKISKQDLKSPDKLQQELQKGFQWTTQHSKLTGLVLLSFLVLGAGISAKSYFDEKSENEIQAKYYSVEKKFLDKKTSFEQAKAASQAPKDPKAKTPPPAVEGKATGDFNQDFGPLAEDMMKIISEKPSSKAAKMAALHLAGTQIEYQKMTEAEATLKKVNADSKDLLSGLVQNQLGTVQANLNDCNGALSTWSKVLSNARAKALHSGVKLKQGLCYENMKDLAKAEQMYLEAKNEDKESVVARSAEKYLRLLQTAKN